MGGFYSGEGSRLTTLAGCQALASGPSFNIIVFNENLILSCPKF
jgi:hypothetical protein